MKHEKFTVTINFIACDGLKAQALEELRQLRLYILGNELQNIKGHFDHAYDVKFHVEHREISE